MKSILSTLPSILPLVFEWVEKQEALILAKAEGLTEDQQADAIRAGVSSPEKIRVLYVETLPKPEREDLQFLAQQIGLFSPRSIGLALGYGIYLRRDFREARSTLVHECVHVGQHERMNGVRPFLTEYLRECIVPGYPFGSLEQEAIIMTQAICGQNAR